MILGKWYIGKGKYNNLGLWDGFQFLVIDPTNSDAYCPINEQFYDIDNGTFQPFHKINEGVMIDPFGNVAWDLHYGKRMCFDWKRISFPERKERGHRNSEYCPIDRAALCPGKWYVGKGKTGIVGQWNGTIFQVIASCKSRFETKLERLYDSPEGTFYPYGELHYGDGTLPATKYDTMMCVYIGRVQYERTLRTALKRKEIEVAGGEFTQIPRELLTPGKWYVGRGRCGNVGYWNGRIFRTLGEKNGRMVIKGEYWYEAEVGTFQAFREVDFGDGG